jgi:hypothetical protein
MSTPVKNPEILFRVTTSDAIVFVDLELEDFFWELNGLAGELWKEIDGIKTWNEIKKIHRESFDPEDGDFDQLSDNLLKELVGARLILLK